MLLLQTKGAGVATQPVPQTAAALFDSIESLFVHGELGEAEWTSLHVGPSIAAAQSTEWPARFLLQQARIELYRGESSRALALLQKPLLQDTREQGLCAMRDSFLAIALARTGDLRGANEALKRAESSSVNTLSRPQFLLAKVALALEKGDPETAEQSSILELTGALARGDRFDQTQALLNIGVSALRQDRYEDALWRFREAGNVAAAIGARQLLMKAEGNAGSTFYKIGDFPHALWNARAAEQVAHSLGSPIDEAGLLFDAGMSQYQMNDLNAASKSFEASYKIASAIQNNEETGEALFALASLSLHKGDLSGSLWQAREAEHVAVLSGNNGNKVQPQILEAQALAQAGDTEGARHLLVLLSEGRGTLTPRPFERWQIEGELAKIDARAGDQTSARRWFEKAIHTYRVQRQSLTQLDSRLPFVEKGSTLYMDYVEELIHEGRSDEALQVLDQSRAGALTEAVPETYRQVTYQVRPRPLGLARQLDATILVYCMRPQNSYVWAIARNRTQFEQLPGSDVLVPLLRAHVHSVLAGRDLLAGAETAGAALYRSLVSPVRRTIAPGGKVYVIADGELSHLNFETLIVPDQRPHFWIEDADVLNAKSLKLLAMQPSKPKQSGKSKLLLIGDPVYRQPEYIALPHAAEEVDKVAIHFASSQRALLTGAQATRAGYLQSRPADFNFIHFVAHGTASELNPLDSAVVLSTQGDAPDTYKLYARDILNHPLRADLVTISGCFGSGVRTYSGEGLVGLAWAFLRAGSHNVVGALWEVSDVSTPQLMGDMYDGLARGQRPDQALRSAKLAMLKKGGVFRKPFYWGAFQLYSGA